VLVATGATTIAFAVVFFIRVFLGFIFATALAIIVAVTTMNTNTFFAFALGFLVKRHAAGTFLFV
jgi:hypothetical protein